MRPPALSPLPSIPRQSRATAHYPRVIDQRMAPDGQVLVTFSLPGLRRPTIRVRYDAWLAGEHLQLSAHLDDLLRVYAGPPDI